MKGLEGVIVNYRRGRKTQTNNQYILKFPGIDSREEASKLIGRIVAWRDIRGKIVATHGNNGAVRARFDKGLPGQALGDKVVIVK